MAVSNLIYTSLRLYFIDLSRPSQSTVTATQRVS